DFNPAGETIFGGRDIAGAGHLQNHRAYLLVMLVIEGAQFERRFGFVRNAVGNGSAANDADVDRGAALEIGQRRQPVAPSRELMNGVGALGERVSRMRRAAGDAHAQLAAAFARADDVESLPRVDSRLEDEAGARLLREYSQAQFSEVGREYFLGRV